MKNTQSAGRRLYDVFVAYCEEKKLSIVNRALYYEEKRIEFDIQYKAYEPMKVRFNVIDNDQSIFHFNNITHGSLERELIRNVMNSTTESIVLVTSKNKMEFCSAPLESIFEPFRNEGFQLVYSHKNNELRLKGLPVELINRDNSTCLIPFENSWIVQTNEYCLKGNRLERNTQQELLVTREGSAGFIADLREDERKIALLKLKLFGYLNNKGLVKKQSDLAYTIDLYDGTSIFIDRNGSRKTKALILHLRNAEQKKETQYFIPYNVDESIGTLVNRVKKELKEVVDRMRYELRMN